MPSFTVVATALAEVISTVHASSGSKTRDQALSNSPCRVIADSLRGLPRVTTAFLALLGTLLAPLAAEAEGPEVVLSTTQGDIVLELDESKAPQTVKNFLEYVDGGFYDETLFHRVIEGFMIQGGGFNKNYQKKSTRPPVSNEAYNGLHNRRYTIAMARTTAPHSATSQFFINSEDNRNLDHTSTTQRGWGYTVFGRVVEGREVVDAISRVRTGPGGPFSRDVPSEPVVILSARRVEQPVKASVDTDNSGSNRISASDNAMKTGKALPDADAESARRDDDDPLRPIEQN